MMKAQNKKIDWPLWIAIAFALALLFSCSSTHKIKSSEKIHSDITAGHSSDSAAVSKIDSAGSSIDASIAVSKKDSSHVKTDETNAEETISVTLHHTTQKDSTRKDSTGPGHPEYAASPVINDIEIDGHKIHSSQGIENVTIKNKNGTRTIDASKLQVSDSNAQASSQTSIRHSFDSMFKADHDTLHSELDFQSKNKDVKRTGLGFGGYALIGAGLIFLFFAWRWGWLRKKKKEDPEDKNKNPLTSVPYNPSPPPVSILIIALLLSLSARSQKLSAGDTVTVANHAWNCGAYSPQKAIVVQSNKYLYVKFDWLQAGERPVYKRIRDAITYWRWEGTKIISVKHQKTLL